MDIVGMNSTTVSIIVGGELSYYLMTFEIINVSTIVVEYVFEKYYECNDGDQFKPQYVFNSETSPFMGEDIQMMAIYCKENRTILNY